MTGVDTVAVDSPRTEEHWPEDLDQAKRWIAQLREAYNREVAYRERLERKLRILREPWAWAGYWAHARGIHIATNMRRLKAEVKLAEEELQEAGLETL